MSTATYPDLDRRLSRKIETHKGIQLTSEELDLFVESGAYDTFRKAVAEYQRNQCRNRSARSRSISGGITPSTDAPTGPTLRLSGTTASDDANAALARARQISGRDG